MTKTPKFKCCQISHTIHVAKRLQYRFQYFKISIVRRPLTQDVDGSILALQMHVKSMQNKSYFLGDKHYTVN